MLLTGLEDIIEFSKACTHYENNPDGTVTAHFADGTTDTGDVLVAADGTNSRVRRQYLPHARLADSGLIEITGKVPLTERTSALLTPKMIDGVSMVLAPKPANPGSAPPTPISSPPGPVYSSTTHAITSCGASAGPPVKRRMAASQQSFHNRDRED
ncbi:MAG: hypothetical protein ACRDQX_13075 [Pseudonocardiaceae bacterium]